mgnify:CR=1 FL=1
MADVLIGKENRVWRKYSEFLLLNSDLNQRNSLFVHSFIHYLFISLSQSVSLFTLINSFIHLCVHLFIHSIIHSFIKLLIHSFIPLAKAWTFTHYFTFRWQNDNYFNFRDENHTNNNSENNPIILLYVYLSGPSVCNLIIYPFTTLKLLPL